MKKVLTALLIAISFGSNGQSLNGSEKAIDQFIRQFNNQEFDSVYNSFSPEYKTKPPLEVIKMTLNSVFTNNGKVLSKELSNTQDEKFTYVLTCEKGAFQATIRIDNNSLINGMLLKPAEKKNAIVKVFQTDNLLKSEKERKLNELIQKFLNSNNCPGMSIAIIDGQHVDFYNYGEAKSGSGKLPTAQSVYDIGSITKAFTATIFEKLSEQRKIDLHDSLGRFIRGLSPEIASIKMIQLLNHTSGLPSMPALPVGAVAGRDPFENYSQENLLKDLKSIQLQSKPGEKFLYSNLGFATLGLVMESVTGKSYSKMVRESILKPLQLQSTSLDPSTIIEQNQTLGFANGVSKDYTKLDAMNPAGGLKSSVKDLVPYVKSMFPAAGINGSLTEKPTFTQPNGIQVGLSWFIRKSNSDVYFHNGGTTGYRSFLSFDFTGKGVVILSNSVADVTTLGFDLMKSLGN